MEQAKMNIEISDNQESIDTRQELNERIDQALAKIVKTSRWSVVMALALITSCLWMSLCNRPIGVQLGCKMILFAVIALVQMFISAIDLLWVGKFKNATRQEQLEGVLRHRKRGRFASIVSFLFFFLYILVDIIFGASGILRILFAAIIFAVFVFVYWVTYDKTSVYQRAAALEDDVRQLTIRRRVLHIDLDEVVRVRTVLRYDRNKDLTCLVDGMRSGSQRVGEDVRYLIRGEVIRGGRTVRVDILILRIIRIYHDGLFS